MPKIKNILHGHLNEVLGKNKDLSQERLKICRKCPLYKETNIGPICNPDMYISNEDNRFRYSPADGFTRGCGCRLNPKTKLDYEHCPAHKWGSV